MEGLWRGWRFAMTGMKKLQDIFGLGIYTIIQLHIVTSSSIPLV